MSQDGLRVVEGISGYWFYHLRRDTVGPALCGARVMNTGIPITAWGRTPPKYHLPEKWCHHCAVEGGLVYGPLHPDWLKDFVRRRHV